MGILEYVLDRSKEANLNVGGIGVPFEACINCVVFFLLNVCGGGFSWLIVCVNSFDNLNAVSFRPFTMGRMGWLCLWIFVRPFMVGAEVLILSISIWNLMV
jgi:hypothetical protein